MRGSSEASVERIRRMRPSSGLSLRVLGNETEKTVAVAAPAGQTAPSTAIAAKIARMTVRFPIGMRFPWQDSFGETRDCIARWTCAGSLIASHPRPHQMPNPTPDQQAICAITEIARVDFLALQKLRPMESQTLQLALQFSRIKEQLKRLSIPGHALRQCIERLSLPRIKQRRIHREIKYHSAAPRHSRNEAQRGHAGIAREIRSHAQPREKRCRARIESRLLKPIRQRLPLEVDSHESQRLRNRNAGSLQLLTLPRLGRGMIHLKHTQPCMRIAISKRIKAGAEDHVLPHAVHDAACQFVLGIAATRRHG